MTKPIARDPIYRRRVFEAQIIELCVRWYITYQVSYRNLVGIMAERGVTVARSAMLRWVTRYVPEYEKRWNRFCRPVGTSWRTAETYVSIRGKWHDLYRAVDKQGKTVDFLLRRDRGIAAAVHGVTSNRLGHSAPPFERGRILRERPADAPEPKNTAHTVRYTELAPDRFKGFWND
jgi:transposase-like protein